MGKARMTLGVVAVGGLLLTACGDDDGAAGGDGLAVTLAEWSVSAPDSASGGSVLVTAENAGLEVHELVIVRADSVDGWEQDGDGKVLEDQFADGDFIGEIEEFNGGTTESGTFELDAGTYVLFCNIVEEEPDGSVESHFNEGMVTTIEIS